MTCAKTPFKILLFLTGDPVMDRRSRQFAQQIRLRRDDVRSDPDGIRVPVPPRDGPTIIHGALIDKCDRKPPPLEKLP
jgi:hypothetical protein